MAILDDIASKFDPSKIAVTSSDFKRGERAGRTWKEIERLLFGVLDKSEANQRLAHRHLGVISHQAIFDLLAGRLPKEEDLRLCTDREKTQKEFPPFINAMPGRKHIERFLKEKRSSLEYLEEVFGYALEIVYDIEEKSVLEKCARAISFLPRLSALLIPIFGAYVRRALLHANDAHSRLLVLLTFLSWAKALVFYAEESSFRGQLLLREIPALNPRHGMSGWRMDILGLCLPQANEGLQKAEEIRSKLQGHSAGEVAKIARKEFGEVSFRITELKFGVGDAHGKKEIIAAEEIATGPIRPHQNQVEQYLILAAVDEHLLRRRKDPTRIWEDSSFSDACVMYFLPSAVTVYGVTPTPEERKELFVKYLVEKAGKGTIKAYSRAFEIHLARSVADLVKSRSRKGFTASPTKAQGELFPPNNGMETLIEHFQEGK
ncbi:MAG: hypothetical protein AAB846_00480 [Patescibacteria group bacterium]